MEDILQVKREMWIAIADFPNVLLVVFLAGMCSSILPIHVQICALRPATFLWAGYDHVLLNYSWKSIMDLKQILAHRPTVSCISPAWAYNALSVYKLTLECNLLLVYNTLSTAIHFRHLGFHLFDDDLSKSLNLERKPFYLKQNHKGESRDRIHKFANSICQSTKLVFNFLYLHQKLPRNSQLNQILKNNLYQNKF